MLFRILQRAVFGPTANEIAEKERDKAAARQAEREKAEAERQRLRRWIAFDAESLGEICIGKYEISRPEAIQARAIARQLAHNLDLYIEQASRVGP